MSSTSSMAAERRSSPGLIPAVSRASRLIRRCELLIGCSSSVYTRPRLVAEMHSSRLDSSLLAAATNSYLSSNATMPP